MKTDRSPEGYFRDSNGNLRTPTKSEIAGGKMFISFHYMLEPGATTLRPQFVNPFAAAMGRLGGKKKNQNMSKEERIASARHAAEARWGKKEATNMAGPSPSTSVQL